MCTQLLLSSHEHVYVHTTAAVSTAIHVQAPEHVRLAVIQSVESLSEKKLAASQCDYTEAHIQDAREMCRL